MKEKYDCINISMPNLVNICVDEHKDGEISGRLYHCYKEDSILFSSIIDLLREMEALYDQISFPQASTRARQFGESEIQQRKQRPQKVVNQTEVIEYRGKLASFITSVRFRQNSTWQGEFFWAEQNLNRYFSNTLDFIKHIDNVLGML